jgi:hypothetical protein
MDKGSPGEGFLGAALDAGFPSFADLPTGPPLSLTSGVSFLVRGLFGGTLQISPNGNSSNNLATRLLAYSKVPRKPFEGTELILFEPLSAFP